MLSDRSAPPCSGFIDGIQLKGIQSDVQAKGPNFGGLNHTAILIVLLCSYIAICSTTLHDLVQISGQ
uniref:Uncharacterized protein n=1 Tax=Arundo donax TaxID=35708 RepID=A0A0A9BQX2_ARUDO